MREAHLRFGTGVPLPAGEVIVVPDMLANGMLDDAMLDRDAFGEHSGA